MSTIGHATRGRVRRGRRGTRRTARRAAAAAAGSGPRPSRVPAHPSPRLARLYGQLTVVFCLAAGVAAFLRAWHTLLGIAAAAGIVVVLAVGLHSLRDGVRRGLPRRSSRRDLARALAVVDAMDGPEFERHVAALCARDGCTDVRVDGGAGDLGADVTGYLPDGRLVVVQCKRYAPDRSVGSPDMQRFVGTARPVHGADAAVFVTTCRFTAPAHELALSQAIVLVDRDALREWMRGTPLTTIVAAVPDLAPPPL